MNQERPIHDEGDPMTDLPAPDLQTQELLTRIRRTQVETDKLAEETRKFVAEQHKLMAEAQKLNRDRGLAPWGITVSVLSAGAALAVAIVSLLKSMGIL